MALQIVNLTDRATTIRPSCQAGSSSVAIARAFVSDPAILVADEPTGDLDRASAKEILTMERPVHELGKTIIMVTP